MSGKHPAFILINLLFSVMVMAQRKSDSLREFYIINSDGYSIHKMKFQPNGRFLIKWEGCTGSNSVDSGFWKANEDNSFFIQSSKIKNRFYIVHYDQYLFFISDAEIATFTKETRELNNKYIDGKWYGFKGILRANPQINDLLRKYYSWRL